LLINAQFDAGNIVVQSIVGNTAQLALRVEPGAEAASGFSQWFYFQVSGVKGRTITLNITNCGTSFVARGWVNYRARYSNDQQTWFAQAKTSYDNGVLTIEHVCTSDVVWFAYFAPYSMERHHDLIARIAQSSLVAHVQLGASIDGQSIDCLRLGAGSKQAWFFARQHPGESMAQWFVEGLLEALTQTVLQQAGDLAAVQNLLTDYTFHIVPNMNPDGSRRGHIRTNAIGVDLNREWQSPSFERSPEVLCVLNEMIRTGVDFAMDVHGDESIEANFFVGYKGIPNLTDEHWARFVQFRAALTAQTPEFQDQIDYGDPAPGKAGLNKATNQLAHRFGCLAMTLEMPFKDHHVNPDDAHGWSPDRCKRLAHDCLRVLANQAKI
jgi:murein tripeptide amidase MpaA